MCYIGIYLGSRSVKGDDAEDFALWVERVVSAINAENLQRVTDVETREAHRRVQCVRH